MACRWDPTTHSCHSRDVNDETYICLEYDIDTACNEQAICLWAFHSGFCKAFSDINGSPSGSVGGSNAQLSHTHTSKEIFERLWLQHPVYLSIFALVMGFSLSYCALRPSLKRSTMQQEILLD